MVVCSHHQYMHLLILSAHAGQCWCRLFFRWWVLCFLLLKNSVFSFHDSIQFGCLINNCSTMWPDSLYSATSSFEQRQNYLIVKGMMLRIKWALSTWCKVVLYKEGIIICVLQYLLCDRQLRCKLLQYCISSMLIRHVPKFQTSIIQCRCANLCYINKFCMKMLEACA